MFARKVQLICLVILVLYIVGRMPFPLLVIPLVGCTVIHVANEIGEMKNDKAKNKNRSKKVKK